MKVWVAVVSVLSRLRTRWWVPKSPAVKRKVDREEEASPPPSPMSLRYARIFAEGIVPAEGTDEMVGEV
jgi:hypothetical protein